MSRDTEKQISKAKIANLYFNKKYLAPAIIIDSFLRFIYAFKRRNLSDNDKENYKTILVLESHLIGDVIMGLPAYRAIRSKFPDAELIYWGDKSGKDLLQDQDIFDKFFTARIPWAVYDYSFGNLRKIYSQAKKLKNLKPDLALDFRGDIRNIFLLYLTKAGRRVSYDFTGGAYWLTDIVPPPENWHLLDRNINVVRYIGAENNEDVPRLEVSQAKLQTSKKYLNGRGLKNIVFIHSGASQPKRLWSSERFARIADYLHKKGYSAVLLAGPNDKAIVESIVDKCNKRPEVLAVPLKEISGYLACGEFFIGLDSGIAHRAAALGKNVIVLFGPQPFSIACPRGYGRIIKISKGDFDCRPCNRRVCDRDNACMRAIETKDVIEAIERIESNR